MQYPIIQIRRWAAFGSCMLLKLSKFAGDKILLAKAMSMDAEDWDLDLCCSESSADFSPDSMQSRGSVEGEDCLVEYRVFSAVEARSELQWLLQSEARFCFCRHPAKTVETVCAFRIMLVDTLCNVRHSHLCSNLTGAKF